MQPRILTPLRTAKGRELRRQGIEVFGNRYLAPRTDGCSNTITTVQKDNLLLEPRKRLIPLNTDKDGNAKTVLAGYHKFYAASLLKYGASGTFIAEKQMETDRRQEVLQTVKALAKDKRGGATAVMMPNGNIRGCVKRKGVDNSIPELQITYDMNEQGTLTTSSEAAKVYGESTQWRIRKLTARECLRLMDVSDSDIDKIQSATITKTLKNGREKVIPISKSALYKCAGNSIVVSCLYHIFRTMFIPDQPEYKNKSIQRSLFD